MDSAAQKANLKQYRAVGGKWKFVPVVNVNGKPDPRLVLIDGEPTSFKGGTAISNECIILDQQENLTIARDNYA